MARFTITDFEGDLDKIVTQQPENDFLTRRAALVSVGAVYEDFGGPLSEEQIASADRIIAERAAT
ncbi:MAG: hypothetical protein AB7S74_18710 [Hyphomicrobium sp.]